MRHFLMVDIGAGTMDILYYDAQADLHYKAVVQSPVRQLAAAAAKLPGALLITGTEMGGGPITAVLKDRCRESEVVISASAAATLHHDPARVKSWGISVVDDQQAEELRQNNNYSHLYISDFQEDRLQQIVDSFGVPFSFDAVGFCAQDHGVPPAGRSHLDYRHNLFTAVLDQKPFPDALLFRLDEVPDTMNRLGAIANCAAKFPASEVYVMDSGMAAILGASMDVRAWHKEKKLLLDIATSHSVGAAMEGDEIAGFFEYHTSDVTRQRLETLLGDLSAGTLVHDRILKEGGHGAYTRKSLGVAAAEIIIATGPKRKLLENSRLPITFGAPLGDNMMTGTVGLLEAIRRRKGLEPISYL